MSNLFRRDDIKTGSDTNAVYLEVGDSTAYLTPEDAKAVIAAMEQALVDMATKAELEKSISE